MAHTVTLRHGPVSLSIGHHRFERGKPVPINDDALAASLKHNPDFEVVSDKQASAAVKAAAPKAKPAKAAPPPPPPEDDEEVEEEAEAEDDEEDLEEGSEEEETRFSRADLKKLKKEELAEIAADNKVEVDPDASKSELIDAIMEVLGEEEDS